MFDFVQLQDFNDARKVNYVFEKKNIFQHLPIFSINRGCSDGLVVLEKQF